MSLLHPVGLAGRLGRAALIVFACLILVSAGSWLWFTLNPVQIVDPPPAPLALFRQPIPVGPDADLIGRGRYATIAGDCVSCHTRAGGQPFAGGLGLKTPFGVIYSSNITGDPATGIGKWTPDQFFRALHHGVAPGGKHLYPAFPYPHFTIVSRGDADAILAYLKTVSAVGFDKPANRLPFPLDVRLSMIAWNALNFAPHGFQPETAQGAEWNRGAYLVEGLAHCGACHTPKTALGADDTAHRYQGGNLAGSFAPDLTGNSRSGLGGWSAQEIVEYLKTGRNAHSNAAGQMAEVVSYSTSMLNDADLMAIARYLKSLRPGPVYDGHGPSASAMKAGSAIYADACTGCHRLQGRGSARMFPPLAGSAATQQHDPTGVIRLILAGGRTAPTLTRPSFQSMPSFAWKLTDQQIADVATYVRNSWGNRAEPVDVGRVTALRDQLDLRPVSSRRASQ